MKIFLIFSILFMVTSGHSAQTFTQYKNKPKLVLLLVVDQFRADFFTRLQKKLQPEGNEKKPGGFQYLLSRGAYYPLAEYKVLAAMTCPGHAMISTGAYPAVMGISLNEWHERSSKSSVGCVEDAKDKVSPRRLKTSTLGDELKIISPQSKVVSLAIKDRSAVMLGGHHANYAFWFGNDGWQTSSYYADKNPNWVDTVNKNIFSAQNKKLTKEDVRKMLATPSGVEWTVQLALKALESENLGSDDATDILALSFSSHDMAGHTYGPFSPEVEAVTLSEDKEISKLLQAIQKKWAH